MYGNSRFRLHSSRLLNPRPVYLAAIAVVIVAILCGAQATIPIPPSPTAWVTDTANFLSPGAVAQLNGRLSAYQQQTGRQLLVWVGRTSGNAPIDDFAVRAFEAWKVGQQGIDNGLILFIMAEDRRLRIEVGYGLEGQVPDAIASRIINEIITPAIRAGNPDLAVTQGMEAVAAAIGQPLPGGSTAPQTLRNSRPLTFGQMILYGLVGLVLLYVFITNPSLVIYLLASGMGGGGRRGGGGGWSGGGGFGGGGGRSGGGGASGSW